MFDDTTETLRQETASPTRLPRSTPPSYLRICLVLISLASAGMLWFALPQLIEAEGAFGQIKLALIAGASFLVSYVINRLALERAAPLASVGMRSAAVVGLTSIMIVAGGFFATTFPGLVLEDVGERNLQVFVEDLDDHINAEAGDAASAGRIIPVITTITADQKAKAACEREVSCITGGKGGGYGPAAKLLESLAARSEAVAAEAAAGLSVRDAALDEISRAMDKMRTILSDNARSLRDRRQEMHGVRGEIDRALASLREAVPTALLAGYADELRIGVVVSSNPALTDRVNGFLTGYASSIDAVLNGLEPARSTAPDYPARAGARDAFTYIGAYAPVAILAFAVDVVAPVCLFLYALMMLIWGGYSRDPGSATPPERPLSPVDRLLTRPMDDVLGDGGDNDALTPPPPAPNPKADHHRRRRR